MREKTKELIKETKNYSLAKHEMKRDREGVKK